MAPKAPALHTAKDDDGQTRFNTDVTASVRELLKHLFAAGHELKDVTIKVGQTPVAHKLGRKLVGWFRLRGPAGFVADWTSVTVSGATAMPRPGYVTAVHATTAAAVGPKTVRAEGTGAPGAGGVRVDYDTKGVATLTFHGADDVTAASVLLIPTPIEVVESKAADDKFLYLKASVETTADLFVF